MTRRKKKAADEAPAFESRTAAAGTSVSMTVNNEERTLEAVEGKDGWSITPTDAAEAVALAGFSDEALNPTPPPEPEDEPEPEDDEDEDADGSTDSDDGAGEPGEGGQA